MNHPVIIGAGGVASYLLPVLLKTFRPQSLTIVDKDVLEERNLDRQMFKSEQVGQPKAAALHAIYRDDWLAVNEHKTGDTFGIIFDWFTETTSLPDSVDAIICCADNHMARRAAMLVAMQRGCYAYIGGNEYLDSQAFVFHPDWRGTARDPIVRYPTIDTDETGSPTACQGEAQVASPQLAVANLNCAAKILHLMWVYERWLPENSKGFGPAERKLLTNHLPCELFSSLTENSSLV